MATLFLRDDATDWTNANSWSTTSASVHTGAVTPTATDNCIAELLSGNVNIDAGAVCRSFDTTSGTGTYGGTLTMASGATFTIGDATSGAGNVALKLNAGMNAGGFSSALRTIAFASSNGTAQTITTAGKTICNFSFTGAGGSWQLIDSLTAQTNSVLTLTRGTLDTNGQAVSFTTFVSSNGNVRALTLGSSAITITGASILVWDISTVTNMTLTANTSTITFNGSNATMTPGTGLTYYSIVSSGAGSFTTNFSLSCANFTRTGTGVKTDSLSLASSITCSSTFTCTGNSAINRVLVQSSVIGTARTITAAVVTVDKTDFQDITGAGASTWNMSAAPEYTGDCGGNTMQALGTTAFTTATTQTATGTSSFTWSTHGWTTRVPLPQDDPVISNAFSASQTITSDMPRLGRNITFSCTGSPTWTNTAVQSLYGSLDMTGLGVLSGTNALTFSGRSSFNITSATKQFTQAINITAPSGTYTLQDAFSTASNFIVNNGTFVTGNNTVTCLIFQSSNSNTRGLTFGTSTINITATTNSTVFNLTTTTGLTFSGASSTIVFSTTSTNVRTFAGGGLTYGTLTYTVAGSTGGMDITGANTFSIINFSDITNARTLRFTAATTTTFTGSGIVGNGSSGKLLVLNSITAAGHTLSKSSGIVSVNWWNISRSTAQGGATWYAGANSTDGGNNSGWIFTDAPVVPPSGYGGSSGLQNHQNLQNLRALQ